MSQTLPYKIDAQRRLCITKDLNELSTWINTLEQFNNELAYFKVIEKQLVRNASISNAVQGLCRKNVLSLATFCKYEQALKNEYEYGTTEYNDLRAKTHDKKRAQFVQFVNECNDLKNHLYKVLTKYHRK